jgi:hypothetical protein
MTGAAARPSNNYSFAQRIEPNIAHLSRTQDVDLQ